MDFDTPGWPLIDDFFCSEGHRRTVATQRRYARVRDRLTHYLDTGDVAPWLGTEPAVLLEAEREFHEHGAFWTLLGPDELVCCLPAMLREPWLPNRLAEARTQVSLVARLMQHLRREGHVDMRVVSCAFWDTEAAVAQARRDLAQRAADRPADDWATDVPARLKQPRGPQW